MQQRRMGETFPFLFIGIWLLLLFVALPYRCSGRKQDVPDHMVEKPLLDPIPILPELTNKVYFDIAIHEGGLSLGRITLGLFGNVAPKAVENFRALCTCDAVPPKERLSDRPLCYKDSIIHRIIPDFLIQGGDFTHGDGTGGESIYEGGRFEDEQEALKIKFNRTYLLAMAGRGRNLRSQFFINTSKTQYLDGRHMIFGMVLEGEAVVRAIEREGTHGGQPKRTVVIRDSGELNLTEKDKKPIPVQRQPLRWTDTMD